MSDSRLRGFSGRLKAAELRIEALSSRATAGLRKEPNLLPDAFRELETLVEELRKAEDELGALSDELLAARQEIERERRGYQELFDFAPDGYVETDPKGMIRAANLAAAAMMGVEQRLLVPKPLGLYILEERSREFKSFLTSLSAKADSAWVRELEIPVRSRDGRIFHSAMRVAPVHNAKGDLTGLRWLIRDITERKNTELRIQQINVELEQRVKDRTAELERTQEVLLAANRLKDEVLLRESIAREQSESASNRLAFLAEASVTLAESLDYATTLARVARLAVPRIADWCAIDIREEDGNIRRMAVVHSDPDKTALAEEMQAYPPDPLANRGAAVVLTTGSAEFWPQVGKVEPVISGSEPRRIELFKLLGVRSLICVPLIARQRVIGAISLVRTSRERRFQPGDLTLAEELARRAAQAVDNAMLHRQSQDELTERRRAEVERDMNHGRIQALNERLQRAMRESNHRIKNNLQIVAAMVDLQMMENDRPITSKDLQRIAGSIRALATVHDVLTNAPKDEGGPTVSARSLLERLVPLLQIGAGDRRLTLQCDECDVPTRKTTALCLLINELVGNGIKHGRGEVEIRFAVEGGEARLLVSDDGDGFRDGFNAEASARTGLELVESLARWDLGGTPSYRNGDERGAIVEVRFPVEEGNVDSDKAA